MLNRSGTKNKQQYLSPPLPQLSASTNTSTESFACPSVDEAAQIFHVYSLLERVGGVFGDGQIEGVELTRDGRAQACFASPEKRQHWEERLDEARFGPAAGRSWSVDDSTSPIEEQRETDRYGFFLQSAKKRLQESNNVDQRSALLKGESYALASTKASTSAASPKPIYTPMDHAHSPTMEELDKENSRIAKWLEMLDRPRAGPSSDSAWSIKRDMVSSRAGKDKLRKRIYKGIPDRWRPAVWPVLAAMSPQLAELPAVDVSQGPSRSGSSLFDGSSATSYDTQIDLDIPRTQPGHTLFVTRYGKGQRMLFEVLHELSGTCDDCGYCQGMAGIASICVAYGAGSLMKSMHGDITSPQNGNANGSPAPAMRLGDPRNKFSLHHILRNGFPGLQVCFEAQEILCEAWMPNVARILNQHYIHPSSYATKWYITLYTSSTFEFSTQLRIWDAYLLEGSEFLVIVALAILWGLREYIQHPKAEFESIMNCLSGSYVVQNEDAFMEWCRKRLKRWRKEREQNKITV